MKRLPSEEVLGLPSIHLDGLRIWVHGRQYPEAKKEDDNWLDITALCISNTAEVWTSGYIIDLRELAEWLTAIERMSQTLTGEANLNCIEPELNVKLSVNKLGQIKMIVNITPDVITQTHRFEIDLDQSYLPSLIVSLRKLLSSYREQ